MHQPRACVLLGELRIGPLDHDRRASEGAGHGPALRCADGCLEEVRQMSAVTIYVPCDAAALSVGADETAAAIAAEADHRGVQIQLVRNGSRGLLWLEPLVEVDAAGTRMAYGPVQAADVAGLFEAGFLHAKPHALSLGATAEIPYLKKQERLTFARVGLPHPRSLSDYLAHGGYRGLRAALALQ